MEEALQIGKFRFWHLQIGVLGGGGNTLGTAHAKASVVFGKLGHRYPTPEEM